MSQYAIRIPFALAVLLVLVLAASWPPAEAGQSATQEPGAAPGDSAIPRVIDVVMRRYAFEPAVIEVTEGERIRLRIRSADGVHGFQIKQFKIGKEIPRGTDAVIIDFTPGAAGSFPILCSEYCGDGHTDMKGTLVVAARAATP